MRRREQRAALILALGLAVFPLDSRAAERIDCPDGVPADAVCHRAQDPNGAFMLFAKP